MSADAPVPFVDLGAQHATLRDEVRAAMDAVLERGDFILGSAVSEFETAFATYVGTHHAVGLDSGLSAIELGLRALGVGPGDEVITAANTFIASALPITYLGATPVLVDAAPDSWTIDPERIEAAITPRTKAILPVHLYGHPADMDAILAIAERHGLVVLEDACQAHGARYRGRRAGAMGHAAAFSFYPAKNLGAFGDGGMLVSDDPDVDAQVRLLRNYGSRVKYHHEVAGMNRRLDTLQAAVLLAKLARLDDWNDARRRHAARYRDRLANAGVDLPPVTDDVEHVYHLFIVESGDRDGLQEHLARRRIATGVHYPVPIHLQPAYRSLGLGPGAFPVTEQLAGRILSLPMYPELPDEAIDRVADAVHEFSANAAGAVPMASD